MHLWYEFQNTKTNKKNFSTNEEAFSLQDVYTD